ncbi:Mur ligase, partial [Salmonella enterica subsp. enterica serovar Virchow]|nr:Mur ligase [Salmonella enterica subsp. enterica serovar Virchow]
MTTAILENARTALSALLARRPPDAQHDVVLFFSLSLKRARARTWTVSAAAFDEAWETGAALVERASAEAGEQDIWLRVDAVDEVRKLDWSAARARIAQSKRTYFRQGIVFGGDFASALLEQEINANGILFDPAKNEATPNAGALRDYSRERFGRTLQWPVEAQEPLWLFTTRAVFADSLATHEIVSAGRNSGYRNIEWSVEAVDAAIVSASAYLADQVQQDGRYRYGWLPIEDAVIPSYNALRHASSTYALLEAWEFTRDPAQEAAIRAALAHLAGQLIKQVTLPGGVEAAFLVDVGNEIKLGGNAVCLLAFVKYAQLTGDGRYAALLEKLALGVLHMQRPDGRFVHVLNFPDLTLKQEQRIIYYDGEAAFGLMRLYALTSDPRWLEAVVRAFDHFIEAEHWKAHDHWLSYCVNELTLFRPDARYFRFGLDNVRGYLDFVLERVTTFPTLLELMMAARLMIDRIRADDQHAHLLDGFDLEKFDRALEHRARYLLNGFFWPE